MKIWIILACTPSQGIGNQGKIPWKSQMDLKYFRRFTQNNAVIMGRKTFESIGKPLPNRENIVVSENGEFEGVHNVKSVEEGVEFAKRYDILWVCGGAKIYDYFLKNYKIDGIIMTEVPECICDTFIETNLEKYLENDYRLEFVPKNLEEGFKMNVYTLHNGCYRTVDDDYLDLIEKVMKTGVRRETRNAITISSFSEKLTIDLTKGFPLLTTKKVYFPGVVHELLWFIKGQTDSKTLEEKKVNIWKGNTSKEFLEKNGLPYEEGIGGPIYGFQWRRFGEKYKYEKDGEVFWTEGVDNGFDQLQFIIDEIRTNPNSRRLFMSGWNPNQLSQMCLPPCHVSYQFYVSHGKLSCQMYQRSADLFLGLPFNIASTALLVHLIAKICGLGVDKIHIVLGDAHIYDDHLDAIKEQLARKDKKYLLPDIEIFGKREKIEEFEFDDIKIKNYDSHPMIKAKMFA